MAQKINTNKLTTAIDIAIQLRLIVVTRICLNGTFPLEAILRLYMCKLASSLLLRGPILCKPTLA